MIVNSLHRPSSAAESSKTILGDSSFIANDVTIDSEKYWKKFDDKSRDPKSIHNTITKRMMKAKQKLDSLIGNETHSKLVIGDRKLDRSLSQVTCLGNLIILITEIDYYQLAPQKLFSK